MGAAHTWYAPQYPKDAGNGPRKLTEPPRHTESMGVALGGQRPPLVERCVDGDELRKDEPSGAGDEVQLEEPWDDGDEVQQDEPALRDEEEIDGFRSTGRDGRNAKFYANELRCMPDNMLITEIHEQFTYAYLENSHGFIQWIFPVYESCGMNHLAKPLTKEEAACIRADDDMARRVIQSYKMMLAFYGLELKDETTGEVQRSAEYEERFRAHNHVHNHNWLRISRIIVSLGELGFGRYKRPLVDHLAAEVRDGGLSNAKDSLEKFWQPLAYEEHTVRYKSKTREHGPEDRGESAFFKAQAAPAEAHE